MEILKKKSNFKFILLISIFLINSIYILFYTSGVNSLILKRFLLYSPFSKVSVFLIGMLFYKLSRKHKNYKFYSFLLLGYLFIVYNNYGIITLFKEKILNEYIYFMIVFLSLVFFLEKDSRSII